MNFQGKSKFYTALKEFTNLDLDLDLDRLGHTYR